ncbi:MAG: hypothetical protein HDT32_04750 [Clostridiales bacterium]|nr:hypothetical protein [Clostridiales bacterium]
MKRNKAILFISIILVIAMVTVFAVGCKPQDNGGTTADTNAGETVVLSSVDRGVNFVVIADGDVEDVESKITVINMTSNEVIDSPVVESNGKFRVYPPVGYYELGKTYKISLTDKALRFEDYDSNVKHIMFVVDKDTMSKITMKNGLLVFDAQSVSNKEEKLFVDNSGEQQIGGTMQIQTNGVNIKAGDIIIVNDEKTKLQEAYKVDNNFNIAENTASVINYSKPQMNEVFSEFDVSATQMLSQDSDIDFTYDDTLEAIENSDLALAALQVFGSKPEFGFNIKKVNAEDGRININAVVSMTLPNVVKIEGAIGADLTIKFDCTISVDANVNVNMEGESVDCGVIAYVYNNVETTVELSTGYSVDKVTNLTDMIEKLNQLEEAETGVSVPMFTWVLPIANGAVSVRYQCDLHFAFSFSGAIGVKINTDFNYVLGATYTKVDGVQTFSDVLDDSGFKSIKLTIDGNAKMKLGLANTLALDVLAGVLSLGIKAEVGNFNGLYGHAETTNLLIQNPTIMGAIYFEGGFYYDIDLLVAISIGSIANINKSVDIAQGEIVLYTAGQKELITSIESKDIVLTAEQTLVPEFQANAYDLKTGAEYTTALTFEEGVSADSNVVVEDGMIKVLDTNTPVDTTVTFQYKDMFGNVINVTANVKFDGVVVFDKAVYAYDKAGADRKNDVEIKLSGSDIDGNEVVSVEGASYDKASKTVTVSYKTVAVMANGVNALEIDVNGKVYNAYIEVSGVLDVLGFKVDGVYEIFAAEQIAAMSSKEDNFSGKILKLVGDIDMNGAVIAPIKEFAGTLDGNGKTISNYTIEGVVDNSVAFIAKNSGLIQNLTLSGNVNAQIAAKTGKDYLVAGAVANNVGRVVDVTVDGEINMTSTSLNAFVKINVMGAIAKNIGVVENVNASGASIVAVSQFDIANVTIYVDGNVNYECSCKNAAVASGALVKFEIVR